MEAAPLRAYLVDDEPLAIERLKRLLAGFDSILVAGSATDPGQALEFLNNDCGEPIDVLFLDIQMPSITGFELLARLALQPFVIFTTAYDEYALRAFEVNSIDYLVKPIETAQLARPQKARPASSHLEIRMAAKPGSAQAAPGTNRIYPGATPRVPAPNCLTRRRANFIPRPRCSYPFHCA